MTFSRPVAARARRTAAEVASDPVFANRTRSAPGTLSMIRSAISSSSGCGSVKTVPDSELPLHGSGHTRVGVTEDHGAERHRQVEIAIAVHVPHVRRLGPLDERRRNTTHPLTVTLAQRLARRRDRPQRPLQELGGSRAFR